MMRHTKKTSILNHVALIMDGNRRWARLHHVPEFEGHRRGEERIEPIIDHAIELGITHLTFWAFSTENWYREKTEVRFLLNLYRHVLHKKIGSFHRKNVKIRVLGNIAMFPADIRKKTQDWMKKTENNTKITVNLALSYGGRDEILRAINKMNQESGIRNQEKTVTKDNFEKYLDTAGQPDPDLMIRTGGVQRLSGFLLWQMEYAEFYFTETLWPDFTPLEFDKAIASYRERQRRFGV